MKVIYSHRLAPITDHPRYEPSWDAFLARAGIKTYIAENPAFRRAYESGERFQMISGIDPESELTAAEFRIVRKSNP